MSSTKMLKSEAVGWTIVLGQYNNGLTTFYNVELGASPGHIQYNGVVRFDSGASDFNSSVKSVLVRFRKYGNPMEGLG